MIIRPGEMKDKREIFAIAKQQASRLPKLKADLDKINDVIVTVLNDPKHFGYVAEKQGVIVGVLGAITSPNLWAQRNSSQVVLWASLEAPAGVYLLRTYRKWIKSKRAVKIAGISPNIDLDARTLRLMELNGFERNGGSYLLYN